MALSRWPIRMSDPAYEEAYPDARSTTVKNTKESDAREMNWMHGTGLKDCETTVVRTSPALLDLELIEVLGESSPNRKLA